MVAMMRPGQQGSPKLREVGMAVDGQALVAEDEAVAEAYMCVAAGYRRALRVNGLPPAEVEGLRACLRAALEIAGQPRLFPVRSSVEGHGRSPVAG